MLFHFLFVHSLFTIKLYTALDQKMCFLFQLNNSMEHNYSHSYAKASASGTMDLRIIQLRVPFLQLLYDAVVLSLTSRF